MDSVWGGQSDRVEVTFNKEKAQFARDAWAKGLYARLFEYIVRVSEITFDKENAQFTRDTGIRVSICQYKNVLNSISICTHNSSMQIH